MYTGWFDLKLAGGTCTLGPLHRDTRSYHNDTVYSSQALQFATVASTAPLEDDGTNGVVAFVPSAALLLLVTIAGFLM